jgi:hypothetical protein
MPPNAPVKPPELPEKPRRPQNQIRCPWAISADHTASALSRPPPFHFRDLPTGTTPLKQNGTPAAEATSFPLARRYEKHVTGVNNMAA